MSLLMPLLALRCIDPDQDPGAPQLKHEGRGETLTSVVFLQERNSQLAHDDKARALILHWPLKLL